MFFRKWKKRIFFLPGKKRDSTVNKGTGGFRPTVNWREINIRRKRLANRQILFCIVIVSLLTIGLGVTLLILGLFVIETHCPFGWNPINEACVYVTMHNATWSGVRDFCYEKGAFMIELRSDKANSQFAGLIKGITWIGLHRPRSHDDFQWLSGNKVEFTNWNPTAIFPSVLTRVSVYTHCVMVDTEGYWAVEPSCDNKRFAACEFKKDYNPLVLIGPVVVLCGFSILFLGIEVYHRHRQSKKRSSVVEDDEEELLKKKPQDIEDTSPNLEEVERFETPSQEEPKAVKPKNYKKNFRKKNKVASKSRILTSDDEDMITVTRSVSKSPSKEQLELLLTPRTL